MDSPRARPGLWQETLVKTFIAEFPHLFRPPKGVPASDEMVLPSSRLEERSAQTRIMALSVTGFVTMNRNFPTVLHTSAAAFRKSRTLVIPCRGPLVGALRFDSSPCPLHPAMDFVEKLGLQNPFLLLAAAAEAVDAVAQRAVASL